MATKTTVIRQPATVATLTKAKGAKLTAAEKAGLAALQAKDPGVTLVTTKKAPAKAAVKAAAKRMASEVVAKAAPAKADSKPEAAPTKAAPKADSKPKAAPKGGGRPTTHTNEQVITLLRTDSPKRTGTKASQKWLLYKNGMTVGAYLEKGGKRSTLRWDLRHGFISIK